MSLLKNMVKTLGNEYAAVADDGIQAGDVTDWIDTGSYAFNALVSGSVFGGLPSNKITALAGESTTGKTFFALSLVKNFLDMHDDALVLYFESESAISKNMLTERGIDVKRVVIVPVSTVEDFKNQALRAVNMILESKKADSPMMMCLDSLGMLSTNKEMADSAEGKDVRDMTRSQVIKAAFRVLTLKLGKANIPLIVTNHVYANIMNPHAGNEMSGGSGLKFAASTTIFLTKAKARGEDIGGGSADKTVVGSVISCTAQKSRLTVEGTKVKTMLTHKKGLSRYYGLFQLAIDAGVFVKEGNRYKILDGETSVWKKEILQSPEDYYTQEVLEAIDAYTKQAFTYGGMSEEELTDKIIDIEEAEDADTE
jgi:RecA/RadA recombinase